MSIPKNLSNIRELQPNRKTHGLSDDIIEKFIKTDPELGIAIDMAADQFTRLKNEFPELLTQDEDIQIATIQKSYVNFYPEYAVNPYVGLAAHGPWVITTCGAVIYDAGGYGMLGFGHSPQNVLDAMHQPQAMANIMTASYSQLRFTRLLQKEVGYRRGHCPFDKFLCVNSGSEAMTVAARISDINAGKMTTAGGRHAGKTIKLLSFKGSFHGRTDRPSQVSDSSLPKYREHLASFRGRDNLVTIEPNNINELKQAFAKAQQSNVFFEAMFIEPVMGEGNPGQALDPEFYQQAQELTEKEGTLLICDSIQAGLRAHGCLSVTDYPGFEKLPAPDMETYSKALNAGQYPLSVLAMREATAKIYVKGVYGNTMTTNPRALDVASVVLASITPQLRRNITERGHEFVAALNQLRQDFPQIITEVKGTGLLIASSINELKFKVEGKDGLEEKMRRRGIGVIHGGKNALRFTPHFHMTSQEINLVVSVLRDIISKAA